MSDGKLVPATLESISRQLADLLGQIDQRLDGLKVQIDQRLDELKAQMRTDIEAVRGDVALVAEALAAQHDNNRRNEAAHKRFLRRIEGHEVRLVSLERKQRPS